jgi:Mrp family chromosome partitioning ATPase
MGAIPPNPTELLGSLPMEEFLKRQEKLYDFIIIDTPPVNIVSDALSLAKLVDGVVIVVREGITSHPDIEGAITKYKLADADLLGFVLNGATLNSGSKLKSHYYYYRRNRD